MLFSENETTEFKSEYTEKIIKEVIAFANTKGGSIYIGVGDDGNIIGVADTDDVILRISNTVRDSIRPDLSMFISYDIMSNSGKNIVKIEVQPGTGKPYYLASKGIRPEGIYVRSGSSSVPASELSIRQMIKASDGEIYEQMRSLNQDLTFTKAEHEFSVRELQFGEIQKRSLGIINEEGMYTNLGLLLSDQCPHIIKAATFRGYDCENFQDRQEFCGSLFSQLESAYSYLKMRNETSATFTGLLRKDHFSYPDEGIREALINAVIHRDYSVSASTLISVFDDRIEIVSVGGLYDITYDDVMLGVSSCRNEKLADIFYRMKLIEFFGTGIKKIMSSYNEYPRKPVFQVSRGAFKVTLPNINDAPFMEIAKINIVPYSNVHDRENQIRLLFDKSKVIKRGDVQSILGVSLSTARRILGNLEKSGYIKSEGKGKNTVYILIK